MRKMTHYKFVSSTAKMGLSSYSPDLDLCDYLAISKIENCPEFADIPAKLLKGIPKNDF